jgi:hypothetical protein
MLERWELSRVPDMQKVDATANRLARYTFVAIRRMGRASRIRQR